MLLTINHNPPITIYTLTLSWQAPYLAIGYGLDDVLRFEFDGNVVTIETDRVFKSDFGG